ncbi:MAG: hypothetical protein PHV48_04575 [Candidatus Omnitrophica bacterium]|nr:hypothetical protein [Candidatus Omnitrophota bacterium]
MKKIIFLMIVTIGFIAATNALAEEKKPESERIVKSLAFDPKTAAVSYELSHPAKVRVRIGTKEGPLFRTIVDWEKRDKGLHKEEWDGLDLTKKVRLSGERDLAFTFNYFTEDDTLLKNVATEEILPNPAQVAIGRFLPSLNISLLHKDHDPAFCHEPELVIKLPKDVKIGKDGYAVIKSRTPITIDIAEKDKQFFTCERYSIHIFIDEAFLTGELEGYSPYNFIFDPENFKSGKYLITVNYSGFNDHIGIASLPIYIDKIRK